MENLKTITYAITVCDEHEEIDRLLNSLVNSSNIEQNEIIVQVDENNTNDEVQTALDCFQTVCNATNISFKVIQFPFTGDFSAMKNNLLEHCTKDYIFQLDADEELGDGYLNYVNELVTEHDNIDVIIIPRINVVNGITEQYIKDMRWQAGTILFPRFKDDVIINYPDFQYRLFRNADYIRYNSKVHEVVSGFKSYANIEPPKAEVDQGKMTPDEYYKFCQDWSLIHVKDFEKQKKQNNLYSQLSE